jgi:hypothetical protein
MTLAKAHSVIPAAPHNAALPGAVLFVIGAFLVTWALRGWGILK